MIKYLSRKRDKIKDLPASQSIFYDWIDETTSQSTKPASWQVAGYPAFAGMTA
jgi:hypothetical protein